EALVVRSRRREAVGRNGRIELSANAVETGVLLRVGVDGRFAYASVPAEVEPDDAVARALTLARSLPPAPPLVSPDANAVAVPNPQPVPLDHVLDVVATASAATDGGEH